jgi:hypothetical protein
MARYRLVAYDSEPMPSLRSRAASCRTNIAVPPNVSTAYRIHKTLKEEAAKRALESARQVRTTAAAKVADARGPLVEQILSEVRAGVRQRDIMRRIGNAYTRERVRQICRAAGIEPVE